MRQHADTIAQTLPAVIGRTARRARGSPVRRSVDALPVTNLLFRVVLGDPIALLDARDELIALTRDARQIIIRELVPLFLELALNAFQLPAATSQFIDPCPGAHERPRRDLSLATKGRAAAGEDGPDPGGTGLGPSYCEREARVQPRESDDQSNSESLALFDTYGHRDLPVSTIENALQPRSISALIFVASVSRGCIPPVPIGLL